ncbi:MAG: TIGR04282 family arsenosugar biosynthesis glycosyltransferase [Bryobacteraceae bacterium]
MLPAIAVFAKAPIPGRVKTRLAADLGDVEAARRYEQMVSMLLRRLIKAANSLASDIELHTDTPSDAWTAFPVTRHLQVDGDLGDRMLHSLETGLATGRPSFLILGGDVPTVPVDFLHRLFDAPEDVVLGPAEDGGYYAICCRKTHKNMFANVEWSTKNACEQTAAACRLAGLSVGIGPTWFDIDEPSSLDRI